MSEGPFAVGRQDRYRTYGKTAAARRSLKIPEFLRQALKSHLATYSNAEWVFPAPNGGFLRGDNFRWRILDSGD